MLTPETRRINQSTYTPVINSTETEYGIADFEPNQMLLKQYILTTACSHRETFQLVLDQLSEEHSTKNDKYKELIRAVERIWRDDIKAAARILRQTSRDEVLQFAGDVLKTERALLEAAKTEVEKAVEAITNKGKPKHDAGDARSTGPGGREADTQMSSQKEVTFDRLQEELTERSPQAATFLGANRFFALPRFAEAHSLSISTRLWNFEGRYKDDLQKREDMIRGLGEIMKIEPIGYLHLERLHFTPVGYERGELVYSLPLLPGETVRLSHREWSRTETEYIKLVTTSLETATEEALSEKSELSESAKTEQQHSTALNLSSSMSGGYGPVSISLSVGYNAQNSETQTREHTSKHSQEITKKASSRAKEEHKISFRVSTQYEVEEQNYHEITNPLDHAVRWDYHRMMKKWQVDLYRYSIRLTYDIVIPEPGSYLLRKYSLLHLLKTELAKPNPFNLSPTSITRDNYESLAKQYGAPLDPPPESMVYAWAYDEVTSTGTNMAGYKIVELALPEGYEFCGWESYPETIVANPFSGTDDLKDENANRLNSGYRHSNRYGWRYRFDFNTSAQVTANISVHYEGILTEHAFHEWRMRCYERLVDAAKVAYEDKRQRITNMRDALEAELSREDALVLRKKEREEIMKGVLRWMLGPGFRFYPEDLPYLSPVPSVEATDLGDIEYYDVATGSVKEQYLDPMLKHGEIIRFLQHAIEWENINYVLYPYFWTDNSRWGLLQSLYHGDFEHRSFLRAGAARVVLTIRPGFEKAFLSYVETLSLDELLPADHPYMTVAEELKAMAQTNYPYTPGAQEENPNNLIDTWSEFTPTGALDIVEGTILSGNANEGNANG